MKGFPAAVVDVIPRYLATVNMEMEKALWSMPCASPRWPTRHGASGNIMGTVFNM